MQQPQSLPKKVIGRAEKVSFPELGAFDVPARIDTGAQTTALWATDIVATKGSLSFRLFAPGSSFYTGEIHHTKQFTEIVVGSSMGHVQVRYKVRVLIKLKGKKIRAQVTLADRAEQAYPVLVGRNVLRGKFIVDVAQGKPLYQEERRRSQALQSKLTTGEQL